MGRLRSLTSQSPAIVISIAALVLSLGGGAYATTTIGRQAHSPAATQSHAAKVAFHKLNLINGWQSSQATYRSGNPSYAISGGIVYLSGSLHTAGTSEVFARLPKAARPAHNMWVTVYTFGDTTGTLYIGHNGLMYAFSSTASDAEHYTSLAAVSYPVNS